MSEWRVRRVAETGSTNSDLLAAAREDEPAGAVLVADHQATGRGRLDRTWEAPAGASLLVSLLLRPALAPDAVHRVTQAVAVAAARACEQVANVRPVLKWPNDLMVAERKLAGILAEAVTGPGGRVEAVVVGMGMNVHWPRVGDVPHELAGVAIALDEAAGHDVDRVEVLDALLVHLAAIDDDTLDEEYRERLGTLGRRVRVELPQTGFVGTAVAVNPGGELVVDVDGERRTVSAGDVVHLRSDGG